MRIEGGQGKSKQHDDDDNDMNLIKKNTKQTLNPRTHFHLYDKED